jgi:hypothetical protein
MIVLLVELLLWLTLTGTLFLRWFATSPPETGGWYWAIPVGVVFVLGVALCLISLGLMVGLGAISHQVGRRIQDAEAWLEQDSAVLFQTADLSSKQDSFVREFGRQLVGAGMGGRIVWWWLHRHTDDLTSDFESFCETHGHEQVTAAILGHYAADASMRTALHATLWPLFLGRWALLLAQGAVACWVWL